MSDLKYEILDMIETFKFYNQNPFSSMVYTLTSEGQLSLDFSYDNKWFVLLIDAYTSHMYLV